MPVSFPFGSGKQERTASGRIVNRGFFCILCRTSYSVPGKEPKRKSLKDYFDQKSGKRIIQSILRLTSVPDFKTVYEEVVAKGKDGFCPNCSMPAIRSK